MCRDVETEIHVSSPLARLNRDDVTLPSVLHSQTKLVLSLAMCLCYGHPCTFTLLSGLSAARNWDMEVSS